MEEHLEEKGIKKISNNEEKSRRASASIRNLVKEILYRSAKYKLIGLLSALAYWLLYGYSTGMYFYYSFDITQQLQATGMTNPYFIPPYNLAGLYDMGLVWFPTSRLELDFLLGPTLFSIFLSVFFSLSVILMIYSFRFQGLNKKSQSVVGLFGMIPAIFSGGCCAVPVAIILFGSIVPSSILLNIAFGDPLLLNLLTVLLMLFSIFYTARKIVKARNACEGCKR